MQMNDQERENVSRIAEQLFVGMVSTPGHTVDTGEEPLGRKTAETAIYLAESFVLVLREKMTSEGR